MREVEEEDTWSLMSIVNESARKAKPSGRDKGVLNTAATTTTTTVTTRPNTVAEINNYYLNPSPYQLDTSNTMDPFYNTFLCAQIGVSNNHPFQNSLSSDQIGASNYNNSFQNSSFDASNNNYNFFGTLPPSVTPHVTGVTDFEDNLCNHNLFLDSYQNFLMMPSNPVKVDQPLQDFKEVFASADDNPIFQDGLRQLPPPEQFYLKPKPGSHKIPVTVYHYRRNRKMEKRSVHRLSKDELTSSEKWAWRKYGQKPIKGSPYPRYTYSTFFKDEFIIMGDIEF